MNKNQIKKCFIISPINEKESETRKNADQLLKYIIMPVCEKCNFEPIRVDQINDSDLITETIINKLTSSELVIADISEHNPNVFYEIGYRTCTSKPIIHLKKKGEKIPFDINAIRTLEYDLTDLDNVAETKNRLEQTINAFSYENIDNQLNSSQEPNSQTFSQAILTALYQIQDSITELKEQLNKNNTETIKTIIQTTLNNAKNEETPEVTMMKLILPELIQNPNSLKNFMQLAELENKSNK